MIEPRHAFTSLLVLSASMLGCEPVPAPSASCRVIEASDSINVRPAPPIDMVIAVDSSPSSAPFRAHIAAEAGALVGELVDRAIRGAPLDAIPELHFSVIGGDLGCPGTPSELGAPRTRVSDDAPAHCAAEYSGTQAWPARTRDEIVEAIECLAWASDGCEVQRPLEAALTGVRRSSTGVLRPNSLLAMYVITAQDESEDGASVEELVSMASSLESWLDLRVVVGIPADLLPINSSDALANARADARVVEGGVGCELAGGAVPVARRLLELTEALATITGSSSVDSICTEERTEVLPGVERLTLSTICLPRPPGTDPTTGRTECELVETPSAERPIPPPCSERVGRDPVARAVDAEGRETCAVLESAHAGERGWRIQPNPVICGTGPSIRFDFAVLPESTLEVRCLRYLSDRDACD